MSGFPSYIYGANKFAWKTYLTFLFSYWVVHQMAKKYTLLCAYIQVYIYVQCIGHDWLMFPFLLFRPGLPNLK